MRVCVLYHAGFTHTATIYHYLNAFREHSTHLVEYFNIDQTYDHRLSFDAYDAIIINYCVVSISRLPTPPGYMGSLAIALRNFRGPKLSTIQDEYDFTERANRWLRKVEIDVLLTCVPPEGRDLVFPKFNGVRFEPALTGYISPEVLEGSERARPLAERPIVVGYRGRELPYRVGDMGQWKAEIGRRFAAECTERGIKHDIAVDEDSRFHGHAWLEFIRRCRVQLGSPSASNVFDLDGSLHEFVQRAYDRSRGQIKYSDVRDKIESRKVHWDNGQISPRVFEAVASRTALAMIRSRYSGVLEPDEHYIPVNPDYSNIDDVFRRIDDVESLQAMADRAFDHVVGNKANHYSGYVARIDDLLDETLKKKGSETGYSRATDLSVTRVPMGADPYLITKLIELREQLRTQVAQITKEIGSGKVEIVPYRGTYRVLRKG